MHGNSTHAFAVSCIQTKACCGNVLAIQGQNRQTKSLKYANFCKFAEGNHPKQETPQRERMSLKDRLRLDPCNISANLENSYGHTYFMRTIWLRYATHDSHRYVVLLSCECDRYCLVLVARPGTVGLLLCLEARSSNRRSRATEIKRKCATYCAVLPGSDFRPNKYHRAIGDTGMNLHHVGIGEAAMPALAVIKLNCTGMDINPIALPPGISKSIQLTGQYFKEIASLPPFHLDQAITPRGVS